MPEDPKWSDGSPVIIGEAWHWEVPGERHHSPLVWALPAWIIILAMVVYLLWHIVRAAQ